MTDHIAPLITEPEGYFVTVCSCNKATLGLRKPGSVDVCQVCGYITREQFVAMRNAILRPIEQRVNLIEACDGVQRGTYGVASRDAVAAVRRALAEARR